MTGKFSKSPILLLDNSFTFGGAIISLAHLLRALDKERFLPVLVTGQSEDYLTAHFADYPHYHYISNLSWINNHYFSKYAACRLFKVRLFLKGLKLSRFLYRFLAVSMPEALMYRKFGRKHQICLVHLNNILGSQSAGIIAAKLLGVPCVAHLRDFEEVHPITRTYARMIDHHIAISGAIRDNLLQLGVPPERISVVHDAIDLNEFRAEISCDHLLKEFEQRPDQLRFGIFGRVVKWKGIQEFLIAAREVFREFPDARAFVVGGPSDGDEGYWHSMQQLAVELGIADKIVFTGYRKDIPALMQFMDVIVHASIRPEPFGMVLIEGMAMGKPVVATRGGGPLDIVAHGETGFLVEMGDSRSMGEAIGTLLRDPVLRGKVGAAGRARVEREFSNQRYAEQMQEIYHRMIERNKCWTK